VACQLTINSSHCLPGRTIFLLAPLRAWDEEECCMCCQLALEWPFSDILCGIHPTQLGLWVCVSA